MSLFVNLMALAVPVFVLQIYDRVVFHAGLNTLYGLVIGMAVVLVFDWILRQSRARILQTVAARADVEVGRRLFNKMMALPLPTLESRPAAFWHALFRDVDTVRNTVSGASAVLLCDLPFTILFLGLVFVIAEPIAWVLLVMLPIFVFVAWRSGSVMASASRSEQTTTLDRERLVAELVSGRTTVKALALEGAMRPLWEERHAATIERAVSRGARTDAYTNLATTLTMVTTVALTAVGAIAIINQQLTIGALIATNILASRLLGPLTQLVAQWRTYAACGDAARRLGEVFEMPDELRSSEMQIESLEGDLVVEGASFAYAPDARPAIDGVRHTFKAPGVHALIGRNGSGKTTLLKMLQGLYGPSEGRVLLGGADLSQFTRAQLARWIGYMPQECTLFAGTLRDNIAVRMPDASDEEVIAAATLAGAHTHILDLPDGYGTEVGEAGAKLSAGQRQRVAIARALIGNPSVVLMDEPSSNLDREAEHDLRTTLATLGKDKLVVVVTHSPILLGVCDTLVALDKGRIAIAGPSREILPRVLGGGQHVLLVVVIGAGQRQLGVVGVLVGPAEVEDALEVLGGALVLLSLVELHPFLIGLLRGVVPQPPGTRTRRKAKQDDHEHDEEDGRAGERPEDVAGDPLGGAGRRQRVGERDAAAEQQDRPPVDVDEVLPLDGVREHERRDRVQPDHHVVQQPLVALHAEQRRSLAAVERRPYGVGDLQADQTGRPLEQPLQPADHPQRRRRAEDVRHPSAARGELPLLPEVLAGLLAGGAHVVDLRREQHEREHVPDDRERDGDDREADQEPVGRFTGIDQHPTADGGGDMQRFHAARVHRFHGRRQDPLEMQCQPETRPQLLEVDILTDVGQQAGTDVIGPAILQRPIKEDAA